MQITSGSLKKKNIIYQKTSSVRPTKQRIRQAIFNILIHQFDWYDSPKIVLDCFAGSGAFGLEALSHQAEFVMFVDKDPQNTALLHQNIHALGLENRAEIQCCNVTRTQTFHKFNIIFMDPPYLSGLVKPTLEYLNAQKIIQPDALVIIESAKKEANLIQKICEEAQYSCLSIRSYGKISIGYYKN